MNAKQGFREFQAARRTIQGYEATNMIGKSQVRWLNGNDVRRQIQFYPAKQGFREFQAARRTTQGYEAIHDPEGASSMGGRR